VAVRSSLFDAGADPVLPAATGWVANTLLGDVAVGLCVLAVAFVGFMLMTGRVAIREGVRVAIGCFVLLGAPIIAAGLHGVAEETARPDAPRELVIEAPPAPSPTLPSSYDPYAGASLRRD
jgi:type IV secretory pathway VirB2 component (pilin)